MKFFIALILIFTECSGQDNGKNLKIGLIRNVGQTAEAKWIEEAFTNLNGNNNFELINVEVEDENSDYQKICESFNQEVSIMLDISWSGNEQAQQIAETMDVPYFLIDMSISPALILLDSYLDLRNSTDVAVIFDNAQNIDQALYFWLDTVRLRMVISEDLNEVTAARIRDIRPSPNNIAIIGDTENVTRLFKTALRENLVTLPERWNLVFLDFEHKRFDRSLLQGKPINLLTIHEEVCCKLLKLSSCDCPSNFLLGKGFANYALDFILKIIDAARDDQLEFSDNLQCNETMYNKQTSKRIGELIEVSMQKDDIIYRNDFAFRVNFKGSVEVGLENGTEQIAIFNDRDERKLRIKQGKVVKPIKAFYRIGITHAIPWSYKEIDPRTGSVYWSGYCADFARKLATLMNFDFEFVEPKNGTFGKKVNGIWDGVVGDLATGDTDLAITAIIMTADKEEVVDFVAPYFEQTGISIVMRKPVRKTSLFKFMTVLKLEVWLSIVAALIVTGFMIWFLDKYSPYSAQNNKKAYPYPCREFTLKESFWFALTSFTPQGGGEAPKALSGRTLVAAYWLFVVLMLATFTANLAAFLTVERMQAPVQSLEQLARQSRINYTVVESSETHKYFINMKNAEDTLYRMWKELTLNASTDDTQYRVWDYPIREQYGHILLAINDSIPVANASEGFRLVNEHLDADFAFIHDSSEIKYEISRNCNLTEVGEVFAEKPYAVAVQQGSHLQDDISKMILNLQKERFFEQLQAKYWNHSAKGNCPSTDDNEGITLESLGGVFIATLFGLALAMITLAGEVLYYRKKRKNEKNKPKFPVEKLRSDDFIRKDFKDKGLITIGSTFKPVTKKLEKEPVKVSHISLYPRARNRITQVNN